MLGCLEELQVACHSYEVLEVNIAREGEILKSCYCSVDASALVVNEGVLPTHFVHNQGRSNCLEVLEELQVDCTSNLVLLEFQEALGFFLES